MEIKQCEIWMVKLEHDNIVGHEQRGNRPFFVISETDYNRISKTPVGFFVSTSNHKKTNRFSLHVGGNTNDAVNVSQVRTLSDIRFLKKIGEGTMEDLSKLMLTFQQQIVGKKTTQ